ncbi:hypothetical protein Tco_1312650 [Tanacetum coccineum]
MSKQYAECKEISLERHALLQKNLDDEAWKDYQGRKVNEAIDMYMEMIQAGIVTDKELLEIYLEFLCEVDDVLEAKRCVDNVGFFTDGGGVVDGDGGGKEVVAVVAATV